MIVRLHLGAYSRKPSCLSFPEPPRIQEVQCPHHTHGWSPCCCCAGPPPTDTWQNQATDVQMLFKALLAIPAFIPKHFHSLLFDPECGGVAHAPRMHLCLAAVPQVDDGFVDVEQNHGSSGAQAAAVAGHLQQVAFHRHVPTHTIEAPFTWKRKHV